MQKMLNIGVVGCGYWGPNLIRNLRGLPDCKLQVMCDANPQRLEHLHALYPEIEGERDFSRMLDRADLDGVMIATSVKHHYPMAKASLLAGKHTFIEKPMASSAQECAELIEIARKKGLILMVGHTFLYSAPIRKIKHILDCGDIGELQYISSRRLNLGLFQKDINVTWDLAPHDISIVLYLMNQLPVSVNCSGNAHITAGVEDVTSLNMSFAGDYFASIQSSWLDPRKVRDMTIVGSKRMIVYDDMEPLQKIKIYDTRVETPPHYDTFAEFQYAYHYGDVYIPHIKQEEPLKIECQHFLDCIRHGKPPLTSGQCGLDVVKVLEAASASLKQNGAAVPVAAEAARPSSRNRSVRGAAVLSAA